MCGEVDIGVTTIITTKATEHFQKTRMGGSRRKNGRTKNTKGNLMFIGPCIIFIVA